MLAGDLVKAPLQRLSKAKVVAAQRQNLLVADRVVNPIRERDLDVAHAPIASFSYDGKSIDQAEIIERLLAARNDISLDAGSGEALKRFSETDIGLATGGPVCGLQQIERFKPHEALDALPLVDRRHDLTDAKD